MNKKVLLPTFLFLIVFIVGIVILSDKNNNHSNQAEIVLETSQIILFYGDGCPHCEIVEEYVEKNNIESKISFVRKEVYNNQSNAKELETKAKICGLPTNSIGVPFLWDGEKCLIGDQEITSFFKQKTNE